MGPAASAAEIDYEDSEHRWWLFDTGCPHDLISRDALSIEEAAEYVVEADMPIELETANGEVTADEVVHMQLMELGEHIEPYLLESTPEVLSVGYRCQALGYSFHWPAGSDKPYLISPGGTRLELVSRQCVPYLRQTLPSGPRGSAGSAAH